MAVTCTPGALIDAAVCFTCDSLTEKQLLAIQVYLLCQIASGGGSFGVAILTGAGDPNGSAASTGSPQFYMGTSPAALYINTGAIGSTAWQQLI